MVAQVGTLLLFIVLFIALISLARSARIVSQYEKGLILRLGRYHATADSGLTFLAPLIDDMIKVDMREQVINVEPQKVITKDNVSVTVDAVIYYRVIDPVKATFEVQNFGYAATTLAQTNLRNLIGDKSLDETLTARDIINTNLRAVLDEATNTWGVKVTRVEVQKIDPPVDITEAMCRQMKAERDKRANILESEGVKQARSCRPRACASPRSCRPRATPRPASRAPRPRPRRSRWSRTRPRSSSRSAPRSASSSTCSTTCSPTRPSSSCPRGSDLVNVLGLDDKTRGADQEVAPAGVAGGRGRAGPGAGS